MSGVWKDHGTSMLLLAQSPVEAGACSRTNLDPCAQQTKDKSAKCYAAGLPFDVLSYKQTVEQDSQG